MGLLWMLTLLFFQGILEIHHIYQLDVKWMNVSPCKTHTTDKREQNGCVSDVSSVQWGVVMMVVYGRRLVYDILSLVDARRYE